MRSAPLDEQSVVAERGREEEEEETVKYYVRFLRLRWTE